MAFVELAERIFAAVWRVHFHIPRSVYWLAVFGGAGGLTILDSRSWLLGSLFVLVVGVQGLLRWRWHRRTSRLLVVCRFSVEPGHEGRAVQVQEIVMTSLRDRLPPFEASLVHPVPVTVGPSARSFAARLRRRLGCHLLVHGRVAERPGGGYAVFARVLQPVGRGITHFDWHTNDRTPARARWGHLVELLTPTPEVEASEYPFEFAREVEGVVRGLMGQIALALEDYDHADELLAAAISVAPRSSSHQIDRLRADRALALAARGSREEALALLRERTAGPDPSPHLLRTLAFLLGRQPGSLREPDPDERDEAIEVLRAAVAIDADPQHDMSLYNLAMLLGDSEEETAEAKDIVERLLRTSSFYSRTWYLRRFRGSLAWRDAMSARTASDEPTASEEFRRAARWYSRALRARPRIRFLVPRGLRTGLVEAFQPSPILYANTHDAHREAGHAVRAWWLEVRFQWIRHRFLRNAYAALGAQQWFRAYAYFDWALVGRAEPLEAEVRTAKGVAMRQIGWDAEAEAEWTRAFEALPLVLLWRNSLAENYALPRGLPGQEPEDAGGTIALLIEMGVIEPEL